MSHKSSGTSSGSSWETISYRTDPLRDSLVERAQKRHVTAKRDRNWWTVSGHLSLGDSYDQYDVHLRADGSYHCSCAANRGGEYRKVTCSHRTAVILWRQDHTDPWFEAEPEVEAENDNLQPELDTQPLLEGIPSGTTAEGRQEEAGDNTGESSVRGSAEEALEKSPTSSEQISEGGGTEAGRPSPRLEPVDGSRKAPPSEAPPSEPSSEEGQDRDNSDSSSGDFDPYELDEDDPPRPQSIAEFSGLDSPLPDKFTEFRPDQWRGIIEVVEALDSGVKAVFLSAPTGSGKSLVAAAVPQILVRPFVYTATTHVLQDQVEREFDYAKVLKGRRNYPTLDDPSTTADDCTRERLTLPACPGCPGWTKGSSFDTTRYDDESERPESDHCFHCHPVHACPYQVAKTEAVNARMAVLNTTYFLSETNLVFRSMFRGKELVIIDEADMLENELMSFITVEITAKMRKDLGVGLPAKKTVEESWVQWIRDEVVPAIKNRLIDLPKASSNLFGKPDTETLRARKRYERLLGQVSMLLKPPPPPPGEERDEDDNTPALMSGWVMTGYERVDGDEKQEHNVNVVFKPITVRDYAREYLWNQAHQFVLMSATLISPEQMAYDLGLDDDEWAVVEVPSSFPKIRRPVIVRAEVEVTHKTIDTAYPILVNQLIDIIEEHPDERILVHSNSYKLTRELFFESRKKSNQARQRVYSYFYANEREKALSRYLDDPRGVLIAPSFQRGVDLQGDDCRVIVIAKVPYPYLGDKQISARLYGTGRSGKIWYSVETIRTICQMTGRGMRSADDWAISYILDRSFLRIYYDNQRLFPKWWREAIVFDENDPKWREPLRVLREGAA